MGTPQNDNPNPGPVPNQITSPNPSPKTLSFDEVSKLFSLPLSDAAESLGVCPSILKKVCYDNGLVRWPYRKFLCGKSIEEIKKDAAIEKDKQLAALKVVGERADALASSTVLSSLSSQHRSTNNGSLQESPKIQTITHQPTKDNQIESSHNMLSSTMNNWQSPTFDEFKYGFPSDSLSCVSYRWWGNKPAIDSGVESQLSGIENAEEKKQELKDSANSAANSSPKDEEMTEGKTKETDADSKCTSLLSSLRKRAARDGKQALKLGVYRGYGVKTLDQTNKTVLLQIFKSSLPSEWGDMSSGS